MIQEYKRSRIRLLKMQRLQFLHRKAYSEVMHALGDDWKSIIEFILRNLIE